MSLRQHNWVVLFDDEERGGSLVPTLALAHEHDPDPEMRPYKGPISAEKREKTNHWRCGSGDEFL
jgi:uncharacterized protein